MSNAHYDFAVPTSVDDYRHRWTSQLAEARSIFQVFEDPSHDPLGDDDNVMETLNSLRTLQHAGTNDSVFFMETHPDASMREEAQKSRKEWSKLRIEVGMSQGIYKRVDQCLKDGKVEGKDTHFWVEDLLKSYRREGVDKDDEERAKIQKLKEEIKALEIEFERALSEDSRSVMVSQEQLNGLPEDFIRSHPPDIDGKSKITTNYPDYFPFMKYSHGSNAKEQLYKAFLSCGYPQNGPVLVDLINKRQTLAQMLDFKNHADHRLESEMIENGDAAQSFIDRITDLAQSRMLRDLAEMADCGGFSDPLDIPAWEAIYLSNKVKTTKYAFDASAARQYLPFGRVRDGLMVSMQKLFDIRFEKVDNVPIWHTDVEVYEVFDTKHQTLIGRFYLDLHPRDNKFKHAAQFPLRAGSRDVLPETALVCNFSPGEEALMEHSEVTTFFHEFGHLLHHLFASGHRWTTLCGITCEKDFVEAPSQMLEEWSFDPETLKSFAVSREGVTMPDQMIEALRRSRNVGKGQWIRQQMFYAAMSLNLHQLDRQEVSNPKDIDDFVATLQNHYAPHAFVPDTHLPFRFGHITDYSTSYYCYMWSEVIARDLFTRFEQNGLYDNATAGEYRKKVLEVGGSDYARNFVKDFLGREYNFDAMQAYLEDEV